MDPARREDYTERQAEVYRHMRSMGSNGITVKELRNATGWHHGQASGALSLMHKQGKIARLTEKVDHCKVYVLHEDVQGRDTEPYGRKPADEVEAGDLVAEAYETAAERLRTRMSKAHPRYSPGLSDAANVLEAVARGLREEVRRG